MKRRVQSGEIHTKRDSIEGRYSDQPAEHPRDAAQAEAGLRVVGVSKRFGRFQALDNVSFEVPRGAVCTLLGPSGCGKTTMLRLLAGLERPDSGEITINSQIVSSRRLFVPPESRRIGFVFQSYALWPHMTVYEHVAYPLRAQRFPRGQVRTMVERTIAIVGLTRETKRYPSELSGGQQQRVALARALVVEPTILLLDEPLSNLDAALRQQMRVELLELHRRVKVTAIYVTHDQTEAMALSDMVIVMESGRIVESGSPRDIYDHPQTSHTASFVGSANLLAGRLLHCDGNSCSVRLTDGTVIAGTPASPLEPDCAVLAAVKPEDISVVDSSAPSADCIQAEVLTSVFLGAQVLLRVRCAGQELRVHADKRIQQVEGAILGLRLPPERTIVFRRPTSTPSGLASNDV